MKPTLSLHSRSDDDDGQVLNPYKHLKFDKNVIAKVFYRLGTTGVFSILFIMPPVGDPRILHGENAGDLYLHLQDVSIKLDKCRHSGKYYSTDSLPRFNCFTKGFSRII